MRLATLRRNRHEAPLPGLHGRIRMGGQAQVVARRVQRGDIAVIDHLDLDATGAQLLLDAGVAAVVNAAASISGRYPNRGPELLVAAGVPVLDRVGPEVMRRLDDGDRVRLDGDRLLQGEELVCQGRLLTVSSVDIDMEAARAGLGAQLQAFAHATTEHLRRERDVLLEGSGVPAVRTGLTGRPVVVVTCTEGSAAELRAMKSWLKAADPVIVAVDEGGDAVLSTGRRPDLVVGDARLMSDAVLESGAEVVLRADRDGTVSGLARAQHAGLDPVVFTLSGSSEDAALLLVDAHDPALVVGVGWHPTLSALIDSGRTDMPSAFLTRLRLGDRYVDASAVATLHRRPARTWPLWLLALLLLAALVAVVTLAPDATPVGDLRDTVVEQVRQLFDHARTTLQQ